MNHATMLQVIDLESQYLLKTLFNQSFLNSPLQAHLLWYTIGHDKLMQVDYA